MRLRAVVVLVSVVALEAWLLRGAPARLGGPSSPSWSALEQWYEAVGPTRAAAGALRLAGLLAGGWLLLVSVLEAAAAATSVVGLRRLADAISPRSSTRLGQGLAGLSLTAGLSLPAPGAGIPAPDPPVTTTAAPGTATLSLVETAPPPTSPPLAPDGSPSTSPTTERPAPAVDSAGSAADVTGPEVGPATHDEGPRSTAADRGPLEEHEVEVEPGDSFWSLAVAEVEGRGPADDREVGRYWLRLIEANRRRLVDPSNPDLIYPGQRFTLPPP